MPFSDLRISMVEGTAFIDNAAIELFQYVGRFVTIIDAHGNFIEGWLVEPERRSWLKRLWDRIKAFCRRYLTKRGDYERDKVSGVG